MTDYPEIIPHIGLLAGIAKTDVLMFVFRGLGFKLLTK